MATRSAIGVANGNGSVTAIYCHWDGYIEGVGQTLVQHYNDVYHASELLDMGNASSLDDNLYSSVFYCRDRNEDEFDTQAQFFSSVGEFLDYYSQSGCEYFYLFTNDQWQCSRNDEMGFNPVYMMVGT
jgi:hypothetical protein